MAANLLSDNPELRPFLLSNVRRTGVRIGGGAYGRVEEVAIPVTAAAKTIYDFLQERDEVSDQLPKAVTEFVRECQLMSALRHPHIVQFLGVCFFPDSRLPALVMERLLTSLHDLLDPETPRPPGAPRSLSFFTIDLKCSVLHDVASGLAFLHERPSPIIHRDLSARNVLLNSAMVAKIADLGVARIVPRMRAAATMTKAPGAGIYMPPEATAPAASNTEKSKYDASIDIFSLGVVTIFAIGGTFPCDPETATYVDEESGLVVARTELQRRSVYMRDVNAQLCACGQLCGDHPLIRLIQQCLHNSPSKRPSIGEVLRLLEEARAGVRDDDSERNKRALVRALQTQPRNQNLERVIQDLVTENADLQSCVQAKDRELAQAQQQTRLKEEQLRSSEREKQTVRQQLTLKEAELTRAEKTIRREQQQIREMRQQMSQKVQSSERDLAHAPLQIRQNEEQLRSSEALVADLTLQQTKQFASYACQVSGPGLKSATVNHPTHVLVELRDFSGRPCSQRQNVTAKLDHIPQATPTSQLQTTPTNQSQKLAHVVVSMTSPSRYDVSYTAFSRGQHKLHIQVNDREINGSPITITVYPDPTQLGHPVRVVTGLGGPYGIAYDSRGEMIVSERSVHRVSIFDTKGQKIRTFGSCGDSPDQMVYPRGIAVDDMDNIYVSSDHKLQKFTISGELIKCVGGRGGRGWMEGEFNDPRGVTLHGNQVYVCDCDNNRIQVFDLDLNFVRSIGSRGKGRGKLNTPFDVKFDTAGNMYVAEINNGRVQVLDSIGHFMQAFGEEGEGKLSGPSGLHIADKHVYVSDYNNDCIVVYETSGKFVTRFCGRGQNEGKLCHPFCITSSVDDFIHVCDWGNSRVQIF